MAVNVDVVVDVGVGVGVGVGTVSGNIPHEPSPSNAKMPNTSNQTFGEVLISPLIYTK